MKLTHDIIEAIRASVDHEGSQRKFAWRIGVSKVTLGRYLSGLIQKVEYETWIRVYGVIKKDLNKILFGNDLKSARLTERLELERFEKIVGISKKMIEEFESGAAIPTKEQYASLAYNLKCSFRPFAEICEVNDVTPPPEPELPASLPFLKEIREMAGLSQSQLARLSGVDQRSISSYEHGLRAPTKKAAAALAQALGITARELSEGCRSTHIQVIVEPLSFEKCRVLDLPLDQQNLLKAFGLASQELKRKTMDALLAGLQDDKNIDPKKFDKLKLNMP